MDSPGELTSNLIWIYRFSESPARARFRPAHGPSALSLNF